MIAETTNSQLMHIFVEQINLTESDDKDFVENLSTDVSEAQVQPVY